MWDTRERNDGIISSNPDKLILNKLLHTRENEGKDNETVAIYLKLRPEKFDIFLKIIDEHPIQDERDRMLFSLYMSVANVNEEQKLKVQAVLLSDLENTTLWGNQRLSNIDHSVKICTYNRVYSN